VGFVGEFGSVEHFPNLSICNNFLTNMVSCRIIIPADLAYSKFPDLEPKPMTANDQRALDSVVKNPRRDATILFDVSVERFK